jgi:signal transduction histidine kinase
MIRMLMPFIAPIFFMLVFSQPALSQYQVKHFTTENGLPSNGIKGLQWDESTGFLWIATEAGVVRYNGMSFKTFDINSNPEFGSNRIVAMIKNTAGKILVSGEEGNLSMVKENTITPFFTGGDSAKYDYSHYGAIAASDTLFRQCFKSPWNPGFTPDKVVPLNDTACIGLADGQLYYYSVSVKQPVLITTAPDDVKNVFKIGNQLYCLNAMGVLFLFDVYKGRYKEEPITDTDGKKFVLHQKASTLFWQVGMENPVVLQDKKAWVMEQGNNRSIQFRLVASGIPENTFFNYAQYKKNGNYLFLGSASKGVYIIHKNQLISKQPAVITDINQKNSFYSQIELPDGNIITSEGIIIGDAGIQYNYNIDKGFSNSVYALNDSLLVYSYKDSIYSYNRKTYSKKLMFSTHTNLNFAMAFSGQHLYFANQNGIAVVNGNGSIEFLKYFDAKTAVHLNPYTMIEISPGKLSLASCEGLLGFDTKTNKIDTLLRLHSVCVRSLHKEGDYIFIGTYGGGFYVMKNGILKLMPLDINQYLKYTHCFIKDKDGFYWISTNNGLFKVKMGDIIDAYEKNLPQIYYHYLGKDDGMETTEMNGGCMPCAIRLKNNNFSFPTMDGMLWFNPEKTNLSLPSGNIYIDKILVDGKQELITGNQIISLPEDIKKLDLSLSANAWCKKENLYIDYKLNNDPWLRVDMASDEPRISFSNLSYGKYHLVIRKMNGFGTSNYSYSTIAFTVATPYYHQWWFRILAVLALAGIGYLIFRLRLRQYDIKEKKLSALVEQKTMDLNLKNIQLEKNDQIKTRLISVINHDIITPLKFMHYAGKALVEKKGTITPEQQFQTISEITQTAKDMEMLSSQILNWIIYQNPNERMQKEEFDLHQLTAMVFGVLQFPAKLKNTQLQNNVPDNFVVYQFMEPLRVLIYNLVLNSINFTKGGSISVQCNIAENRLIIQVTDNGLGMTTEQIANLMSDRKIIAGANVDNKKGTGLGYMIIKDLLKMMGGALTIRSSKTNGTAVSVSLALK